MAQHQENDQYHAPITAAPRLAESVLITATYTASICFAITVGLVLFTVNEVDRRWR